ncbi:hypothetical protein [Rhodoplanes roseus]|uniref:Uncharacterized protein n=1 Tax=Rhodoplanes roseus TaxID=29409 RepID=A0A327KUY5_9BRAD|nr:hypothetical protein [Rhodoplanes roseus]RAI42649.1 hypothetical protein CH341_18490 [Rhodoplanes roseus]
MSKFALGEPVKDSITGFEGVATGRAEYITGCSQVLVAPPVDDKGCFRDAHWIDEQRLEPTHAQRVVLDNGTTPGCDVAPPIR